MIKRAAADEAEIIAGLAMQMWDAHSMEELAEEFRDGIKSERCAVFLAMGEGGAIGFAQCGLRHDYVEGTETSPVGYLEGIFVVEEYRRMGIAKNMLSACEEWAKGQGATEFASDCELPNEDSRRFHLKMGFEEANRIICFAKKL